jgi:hypothetical protein
MKRRGWYLTGDQVSRTEPALGEVERTVRATRYIVRGLLILT